MKDRELLTLDINEVRQLAEKWNVTLTAFKKELNN